MESTNTTAMDKSFQLLNDGYKTVDQQNSQTLAKTYSYWRFRIMYSMILGYASFYLVRQNFTLAIPFIQSDLGYSKEAIGWIISSGAIIYGLGKGIAGLISDRSNARYFMSFGLLMSAFVTICLGFSSSWWALLLLWVANNMFQSMGWPPCSRLLTHWFSPKEIGTKWATWNASQQIGAAICMGIGGIIIKNHYDWHMLFFVPAVLCIILAFFLFERLRDTPESLGLPPIEAHHGLNLVEDQDKDLSKKEIILKVVTNKLVWYVCFANFFVYIVRMSLFTWAPTFLREFKGSDLEIAAWQTAAYDITGIFGGIVAGYLSDKVFQGYRGRVGAICMSLLFLCIIFLWKAPVNQTWLHFLAMMLIGFLVTGPQILVGVAAADFASKKVAGAASGLTGTVGYIGTALTGVGIGYLVDHYSWDVAFMFIAASAILSAVFFALTWGHRSKVLN